MFRPIIRRNLRRAGRLFVTALVLCGLLAGTTGFPISPPISVGGAFPCQGHGCGCRSAEQCWFGCCCMTPAQRLAWAKRNDVTPPVGVELLAEIDEESGGSSEVAEVALCRAPEATETVPACCAQHGKTSACCQKSVQANCCAPKMSKQRATTSVNEDAPAFTTVRCHGPGQWWIVSGQPLGLPERPMAIPIPTPSTPMLVSFASYAAERDAPPTRPG